MTISNNICEYVHILQHIFICEYMQPVRKESCGEHQLHLGEELLVEAGVDDPRVEKNENNVEGIGFKEDVR